MMPDLEALPIGEDAPQVVHAVVEIPVGSRNKYEYDEKLGVVVLDRVLPGSLRYRRITASYPRPRPSAATL